MREVTVLTRTTIGLATDARLIENALIRRGIGVSTYFPRGRNADLVGRRLALRAIQLVSPSRKIRANIFVEQIMSTWLPLADFNLFVPNQEWCRPEALAQLDRIDLVLCKTRYAEGIFRRLGHEVAYIGFTSENRRREGIDKDFGKFLHVAGRSLQKGTSTLSKLWSTHPEWPMLTIVTKLPQLVYGQGSANIRVITDTLPTEALTVLQNECGVHLCPSEAEGFGHYICEALGCGAVVVTTDAPPMNELVTHERGILAAFGETKPQALGTNFQVDSTALEAAIERVLALTDSDKSALGQIGRAWFLANKMEFENRLPSIVEGFLKKR